MTGFPLLVMLDARKSARWKSTDESSWPLVGAPMMRTKTPRHPFLAALSRIALQQVGQEVKDG
jgi:hypothetical protein